MTVATAHSAAPTPTAAFGPGRWSLMYGAVILDLERVITDTPPTREAVPKDRFDLAHRRAETQAIR